LDVSFILCGVTLLPSAIQLFFSLRFGFGRFITYVLSFSSSAASHLLDQTGKPFTQA
jgi:hypothetical protein